MRENHPYDWQKIANQYAEQYAESIDLFQSVTIDNPDPVLIQVTGDSSKSLGFQDGDMVMIDRSKRSPVNGSVVMRRDGELTFRSAASVRQLIEDDPSNRRDVFGQATYIIRRCES